MQYVVIDGYIFTRGPNFFKWPVSFSVFFPLIYFSFLLCFDALCLSALELCHGLFENHRVSYVLALII